MDWSDSTMFQNGIKYEDWDPSVMPDEHKNVEGFDSCDAEDLSPKMCESGMTQCGSIHWEMSVKNEEGGTVTTFERVKISMLGCLPMDSMATCDTYMPHFVVPEGGKNSNCVIEKCDEPLVDNCVEHDRSDKEYVYKKDDDKDDEKDEEPITSCPHCGEVDFSSATFYDGEGTEQQMPEVDVEWKKVTGYALCSGSDTVEPKECVASGWRPNVCARFHFTMGIKGEDTNGDKYAFEGTKLEIRDCLPEGTTCADVTAKIENIAKEGGMDFTYSDCELEICDRDGENCKVQDDSPKAGECHFPDLIWGGYKVLEGEHEGEKYAMYMCHPPFVMTPNRHSFKGYMDAYSKTPSEAYMDMAYTAGCYEGYAYVPECMEPIEGGHCGIPIYIENGHAVEVMMKDDEDKWDKMDEDKEGDKPSPNAFAFKFNMDVDSGSPGSEYMEDESKMSEEEWKFMSMMPRGARYECDADYVMHHTVKKDWGWCRPDGSFEVPRCEHKDTFYNLEFRLNSGGEKKLAGNGGIVQARMIMENGDVGDWEYACNDGFNDNAAGAICRTLGFKTGAKIPSSKKMDMSLDSMSNGGFGWTHFSCDHDDTLPQSMGCRAIKYEEVKKSKEHAMKWHCFDFEKMAVRCFDHRMFNVEVDLEMSKRRATCGVQAQKKEVHMQLNHLGEEVSVTWMLDDVETELPTKSNKRRGFMVRGKDLNNKDFKCIGCQIHMGRDKVLLGEAKVCEEDSD